MPAHGIDPAFRLHLERLRRAHEKHYRGLICTSVGLCIFGLFFLFGVQQLTFLLSPLLAYGAYCMYTTRNIHFVCPECDRRTALASRWVCGGCSKEHSTLEQVLGYVFIGNCKRCTQRVQAFCCPYCLETIPFFDDLKEDVRPAFLPSRPPPHIVPEEEEEPAEPTLDDLIPHADRRRHTLILAMPQVGKSEIIKCFVHDLLQQPAACYVLDPHGDMAEQMVRWPNDRLIYLNYHLHDGWTPTINPFYLHGIKADDTSDKAQDIKSRLAQQLVAAVQQITEDFTVNMRAVLYPCILTLLDKPNATLQDLLDFMVKDTAYPLIEFACSRTHDPVNVKFFQHQFRDHHLDSAKGGLRTKLSFLLQQRTFVNLTCGRTTVFLERAWNDRKIVIINLSSLGETVGPAFGALVLSLIQGIAIKRNEIDKAHRIPCHVFIDECYHFVNPSTPRIMDQSLKWGFFLTLAHQRLHQMNKDTEAAVHKLTHLNIVGVTMKPEHRAIAYYFNFDANDVSSLQKYRFMVRIGNAPYFIYSFPTDLLENRGAMPPYEWEKVKQAQRRFYRKIGPTNDSEAEVQEALTSFVSPLEQRKADGTKPPPRANVTKSTFKPKPKAKPKRENPFNPDVV